MSINKAELTSQGIRGAANLALGKPLSDLFALCETQQNISTKKLEKLLNKAQNQYREHAALMRKLSDNIN